jgi:hypothetical protein
MDCPPGPSPPHLTLVRNDMCHLLQPMRAALSLARKASLFPAAAGVDPNKLLKTYLDRLTMFTCVAVNGRSAIHYG